ncbi:hypothetical protein IV203_020074 [Nitzschia inconspicua]|uniref:Uncharacterized protein n=1 Tax=Nitzschia inconspicua TaxID=303405 RepID=A0A9K3Q7X5_9STRA|nr:hypothetical protein IV203_020443 [Nitzschia inconspicua]KAG7371504.1 hypothetical protein IV203_020074 [Nitzschia inconspicua]
MCYVATPPLFSYHPPASPYIICTYLQETMDDSTLPLVAGGRPAEAAGENLTGAGATPIQEDGGFVYSPHELELIQKIQEEAAQCYPVGQEYTTLSSLRENLRDFAGRHGFAVSSEGNKICCTRCEQPQGYRKKRMRFTPVAEEKKRNRSSLRVGCTFSICYSVIDYKSKESKTNKRVKITKASNYQHSNGCLTSRDQLAIETRKAGNFQVATHETRIKTILAAVSTNVKVSTPLLRGLMQPMFPQGTALDAQFIFNFRVRIRQMLQRGIPDLASYTVTKDQEDRLLSCIDVAYQETPEYLTAALECYQELLLEAMQDKNDLATDYDIP